MKKIVPLFLFLVFNSFLYSQNIVLISKDKNENIRKWLLRSDSSIIIKEFYYLKPDSQQYFLTKCKGVIIGGGEDVNPKLYNQADNINECGKIDNYRDSIELVLIRYSIKNKIPLLGICRGQQIINVALGGSLIVDIPKTIKTKINHSSPGIDSVHTVIINKNSWVNNCTKLETMVVNSSHHQAINKISPKLKITAISTDGIIEAIEWKNQNQFVVAIQWHPERLYNTASYHMSLSFNRKIKNLTKMN